MNEPNDTQVLAAFNAFFGLELPDISEGTNVRMRAALLAAGVVAEEPEWEYGVRNAASGKTGWPWTRDEALKQAGISPMFEAVQRIRTEWVPVKHERAGHEGDS